MTTLDALIDYKQLVEALVDAVIVAAPKRVLLELHPRLASRRAFKSAWSNVYTTALLMRVPQPARVGVRIRDGSIPKTSIAGERTAR